MLIKKTKSLIKNRCKEKMMSKMIINRTIGLILMISIKIKRRKRLRECR